MKQPRRISSRQLVLSLECTTTTNLLVEKVREEAIRALADLLLEALGEASREAMEVPNESED